MNTKVFNLYFIRHAQSKANIDDKNTIGGINLYCELTPNGIEQAKALGASLKSKSKKFDAVYSSIATRAQQTASIVLDTMECDLPIYATSELLELYPGDFETESRDIYKENKDIRAALDEDNWNFVPGFRIKGESQYAVAKRMIQWINDRLKQYQNTEKDINLCIFSHGLAIKYMVAELMNWDRKTAFKLVVDNTSVTHISFDKSGLSMKCFNNTDHLISC